jgi:hypothetical protein
MLPNKYLGIDAKLWSGKLQSSHNLFTIFKVHAKHRQYETQRTGLLCLKEQLIKFNTSQREHNL